MLNINNTPWEELKADDIKQQITKTDTIENFFFEFKEDEESPSKLMKEISAFANTYGGYVFIGVDDKKAIKGCKKWTENRIHTTIHDSMSPTPIFDVKSFLIDGADILVIKIEEGTQPPYIVNDGRMYERVSSGSFPIKDSAKLTELYRKQRDYYDNVAKTIELEPIDVHTQWFPQNLCGCIDVGVYMTCHERLRIIDGFIDDKKCEKISSILKEYKYDYSISLIGARILITIAKQSGKDNNGNPITLAGGVQNFLEILKDGSFRYRILLALDKDGDRASITSISLLSHIYSLIYQELVGDDFQDRFIYSEKCEKLSVFRQFTPYYYLDDKNSQEVIQAHRQLFIDHANTLGGNSIVIGNRFPSTGYSHYDHALFDEYGIKWETQSIIGNLFATVFDNLGYVDTAKWEQ